MATVLKWFLLIFIFQFFLVVFQLQCTSISSQLVLLEETRVFGENHWPATSNWQTLSHLTISSLRTLVVIGIECTGSCKSNYHTITTTTAPLCGEVYSIQLNVINTYVLSVSCSRLMVFSGSRCASFCHK